MARLRVNQLVMFLVGTGSLILMYMHYYNFTRSPASILNRHFRLNWRGKRSNNKLGVNEERRSKLLIISLPRTGSSFLGQIFNRHPNVFFLYEPLHTLATFAKINYTKQEDYSGNVTNFLTNIFSCRFHGYQDYLTFLSHPGLTRPHYRLSSRALSSPPLCKMKKSAREYVKTFEFLRDCPPLREKAISDVCASKKHMVVKVLSHRIPRSSILNLLSNTDLSLRVIHLVRDPRAVAWSMLQISKQEDKNPRPGNAGSELRFGKQVETLCDQMSMDSKTFETNIQRSTKNRTAYRTLRFEELAANPKAIAEELFTFAGMNSTPEIRTWIQENTESTIQTAQVNVEYDFYSTTGRNASAVVNAWRDGLGSEQVTVIEKLCSPAVRHLGYY